jgi:hypothetical protein
MGLEAAIRSAILSTPAVAEACGDRVRPVKAAELDARPFAVYRITGRRSEAVLDGPPADHRQCDFEVAVYSDDYGQVGDLCDALIERLDGASTPDGPADELDTAYEDETDTEEETPEGEADPVYVRVLTFGGMYGPAA